MEVLPEVEFEFAIDPETRKLCTVVQRGRTLDVTIRHVTNVVISVMTTRIKDVTEPKFAPDTHGVLIEWRAPLVPGIARLTRRRQRRF